MMGLTSHISFVYDNFSSRRVSFSSMMSLTMMILGLGLLVHALFIFALSIPLVVSEAEDHFPVQNLEFIS